MTYDILLLGSKGERLVDFAASDEAKDKKVKSYVKSFGDCARAYDIYAVIVRNHETSELIEEHDMTKEVSP